MWQRIRKRIKSKTPPGVFLPCHNDPMYLSVGVGFIFFFMWIGAIHVNAQQSSLRFEKTAFAPVINLPDSFLIDSSSVILYLLNNQPYTAHWHFNARLHQIQILSPKGPDSIIVSYRVFPLESRSTFKFYDSTLIQHSIRPEYAKPIASNAKKENWWQSSGMEYSGSFTRGISTGNNQSLLLNSSLNLQLQGDLGNGLVVSGAISDNQIPVQPEGNTRQIQEFDKIFLKLSKQNQHLTAGDFEIGNPAGYFMKYGKKNKGGLLENEWRINDWKVKNTSAIAISKGKTNRMQIQTKNGNQGPYRLSGNNGEAFIIVLAGSEKIWIDGQLMERGEQSDYVIDYNLAEIRFTSKKLITEQSRITAEFEYLDQNYTRSLIAHQSQFKATRTQLYLNVFNEQDSKRPAISSDLDSTDQTILAHAGDDPTLASRTSVSTVGRNFNVNRVYYRERDTTIMVLGNMVPLKYFVYDPLADSSALQIQFSQVTEGKGNYRLKSSTANGRVYEWVSPDPQTAQPRGTYEPIISLIAPQAHFMANAGLGMQFRKEGEISAEIAYTSQDLNRLSTIQDGDNSGIAIRIGGSSPRFMLRDSNYTFKAGMQYEYTHRNFHPLNSFRNVEFARDWNVQNAFGSTDQLPEIQLEFQAGPHLNLNYLHQRFIRSTSYEGIKNRVLLNWSDSTMQMHIQYDLLQTDDARVKSRFFRPLAQLSKKLSKKLSLEVLANRQRNEVYSENRDSLKPTSFSYDVYEAKIKYSSEKKTSISYGARYRGDLNAETSRFKKNTDSYESTFDLSLHQTSSGDWDFRGGGRYVQFSDPNLKDSLSKLSFVGSLEQRIQLWKSCFRMRNFYEVQSGVEPRQEFVFEERKPGEGNFIYLDFNKDGIRQVFEYVYAPDIDTARYVRFQLFNSQYIQVQQASWNQIIQIDFRNLKKAENRFLQNLQLLSLESTFRISSKSGEDASFTAGLNPFAFLKDPGSTLGYQTYLQQSLYFNRSHPVFEVQLGLSQNGQKVLLTSGIDEKIIIDPFLKMRWTLKKSWDLFFELHQKSDERNAELFADQNFNLKSTLIRPGFQFRPNQNTRWSLYANYKNATDRMQKSQNAKTVSLQLESSSYLLRKLNLKVQGEYLHARFNGLKGSLLEFNILDGFKNGDNFIWSVQMDFKIHPLIQLQFAYNGRKAATDAVLHTARMQLRAQF